MDERIRRALESDRTIDITTIGHATSRPRCVEAWFHNLDGRLYITGTPGSRGWYANLRARATPVLEPARRRTILSWILRHLGHARDLETWVRDSPLVEVEIPESEADPPRC